MRRKGFLLILFLLIWGMGAGCGTGEKGSDAGRQTLPGTGAEAFLGTGPCEGPYWPTDGWKTCEPAAVGLDAEKLMVAYDFAANPATGTRGILVVKDGYIVGEAYFGTFTKYFRHESYSMAKSISGCLLGIAISQDLVPGTGQPVCGYVSEWDCTDTADARMQITIEHLLTLTSGLEWQEDWSGTDPLSNDAVLMAQQADRAAYVLEKPAVHEPGTVFLYSTGDPALLTRIIQAATGMPAFDFARIHLFDVIGIPDVEWQEDDAGYTTTYAGFRATIREYAKFAYLYQNMGKWEDRQVVPEAWVTRSTTSGSGLVQWYGYLWHVYLPYRLNAMGSPIPADGYMAEGIYGQKIYIFPTDRLVIVRTARETEESTWYDADFLTLVLESLIPQ